MNSTAKHKIALLIIDAIVILLCIFGFYRMTLKATTPFNFEKKDSSLIISEISGSKSGFAVGDTVLSFNGYNFEYGSEIEFFADGKNIGDRVVVSSIKNDEVMFFGIELIPYYNAPEIITIALVALLFIIISILVILKSDEKYSKIFHWSTIGLVMTITMTSANFNLEPLFINRMVQILFYCSFCLTPVLFFHFVCAFTNWVDKLIKIILAVFYSIAIIIALLLSYTFLQASLSILVKDIQLYITIYKFIFQVFLFICVTTILLALIISYKRTKEIVTKKKLKWLLLGYLGPFAFALLWVIPFILFDYSLLSEIVMHLLLISFPVTVTVAIVKYQLMDIDLIFRRSIVYSIVLGGFIIGYIVLLTALTFFIKGMNETIPAVIAAVLVALMLQPLKNRVQNIVDKKFFRIEYNFREEQKKFLEEIKNSNDIQSLSENIIRHTDVLIPVAKIGFFILKKPGNFIKMSAHKGFDILVGRSLKFEEENLKTDLPLPVAVDDKVEPGVEVESADVEVFRRWGMVLVFPIKSTSGVIHGFIVLGAKKSGTKYFQEDVDLINSVSETAALTMDRIELQEDLIKKRFEAERMEKLSQMKSFFVSTVSHELKTPLTSIKMFAELLRNRKEYEREKFCDYLDIIEGESERLQRLIDNVLDFTKIERGIKSYVKDNFKFNNLVNEVLNIMQYQLKMKKINLIRKIEDDDSNVNADRDAIEEAMINVLSNSIKYSEPNTSIRVSTFKKDNYIIFEVKDEGIGIPESDIEEIFKPFFRSNEYNLRKTEGTGLGLSIVKHIVDAHNGMIDVKSRPGIGTTFSLLLPLFEIKTDLS